MATNELPKFKPSRPGKLTILMLIGVLAAIVAVFMSQAGVNPQ